MKLIYVATASLLITGCAGNAPTSVKCPVELPDKPSLTWSGDLPKTEIELQEEFLKLKAAYEEIVETDVSIRDLWNDCP